MVAVADIIREGRNQLFERGWTQGTMIGPDGTVCAIGACQLADQAIGLGAFQTWVDTRNTIEACTPDGVGTANWNDTPGRTFDEVIDLFDRAEKYAETHYPAPVA